jgi:pilus assembly protein Flp/PilA
VVYNPVNIEVTTRKMSAPLGTAICESALRITLEYRVSDRVAERFRTFPGFRSERVFDWHESCICLLPNKRTGARAGFGKRVWLVHEFCVFQPVFSRGVCDMLTYVKNFVREEEGATMVEYGLMVALIAVALIAAVTLLQGGIRTTFTDAATEMGAAAPGG